MINIKLCILGHLWNKYSKLEDEEEVDDLLWHIFYDILDDI